MYANTVPAERQLLKRIVVDAVAYDERLGGSRQELRESDRELFKDLLRVLVDLECSNVCRELSMRG